MPFLGCARLHISHTWKEESLRVVAGYISRNESGIAHTRDNLLELYYIICTITYK